MNTNKIDTGIDGLNTILGGGYLTGKPTLITGGPGSGKTIFLLLFAHSLLKKSEPVIFITFDETPDELIKHMNSLGLDVDAHIKEDKLKFVDASAQDEANVTGDFDMSILLKRVGHLAKSMQVKHMIVDSIQSIRFDTKLYTPKNELLKLFSWTREQSITLLATMGEGLLHTDELVAAFAVDSLIHLEQDLKLQIMTRYLRVIKCRGTQHGTNQFPFSIHSKGVSLLPIINSSLAYEYKPEYISTGIEKLDEMLANKGLQDNSTVMISGRAGTAKTSLAAKIAETAANQGKKVGFISFEESPSNIINHLTGINIKLADMISQNKLVMKGYRSVEKGVEEHILNINQLVDDEAIDLVIIDPVSTFLDIGEATVVKSMLIRFVNAMKDRGVTIIFTELIPDYASDVSTLGISSLIDLWIRLRLIEEDGEFYRSLNIAKARGINSSNQVKEMKLSSEGIDLLSPYVSDGQIIFGARKTLLEDQKKLEEEALAMSIESIDEKINKLKREKKGIEKQKEMQQRQNKAYQQYRE